MQRDRTRINILFSCTGQEKKDFDPFVEDHVVIFIINGIMVINDGKETTEYHAGDIGFISKNQLLKTKKIPAGNRPFMSINIFLPRETLFQYANEEASWPKGNYTGRANFIYSSDIFLKSYFDSMVPYFEHPEELTENLAKIKTNEIIELLQRKTIMQNILFNFEEDFKIDIEAFMNKNYMHNIPLEQFARLTARSLSTFKRDFQEVFKESPNNWLIKKRLELAHYLITTKGKKPSEVYFDIGFVNFSHFSKRFKLAFGISPSEL